MLFSRCDRADFGGIKLDNVFDFVRVTVKSVEELDFELEHKKN